MLNQKCLLAFQLLCGGGGVGVATLTTVGYGDMVPITYLGRLLGAISAVIGIAMYALPSGVFIVSGFMQEWKQDKLEKDKKKH